MLDLASLEFIKEQGSESIYRCPFCGDSENPKKGHLYVNRQKGTYFCHRCHEKGRIDDLKDRPVVKRPVQAVNTVPSAVYETFLSLLDLHPRHEEDLLKRGLSREEIKRRGYKSIPDAPKKRWSVVRELASVYDLKTVPGFRTDPYPDCVKGPGYLIPVRDPKGRIQALQIRRDLAGMITQYAPGEVFITVNENTVKAGPAVFQNGIFIPPLAPGKTVQAKYTRENHVTWSVSGPAVVGNDPKYTWFSFGGLQVVSHFLPAPGKKVWVIEGILKADITHYFLNVPVIGIAGTAMWRRIPWETWETVKCNRIVIAFDQEDNPVTRQEVCAFAEDLKRKGKTPVIAKWDSSLGKGIDDACLNLSRQGIQPEPKYFIGN